LKLRREEKRREIWTMAHFFTFDMLFERYGRENRVVTEEDREELRKNREFYAKVAHEEDIGSDESIPDTDDEQDFQEIKDPRQVYICMIEIF
jgi:hypothetical protein